uniref:Ig-like domain-containing protein n=1 Tax=Chelonoidis abingdonii TaxID=106734 RepID=A0A8C0HAE5_CHEAB
MGMWLIWCTLLCLTVFVSFVLFHRTQTKIIQTPSLVLKRGQTAQLTCRQTDNHNYMYWYQQQQGKGLQLIYYSVTVDNKKKGDINDGFTASQPQINVFDLNITSVKMEHSAVYFCASSLNTALQTGEQLYILGSGTLFKCADIWRITDFDQILQLPM